MSRRISVKKKHILAGKPRGSNTCAVALALKDAGYSRVHVATQMWCDGFPYPINKRVGSFIQQFDHGNKAERSKLKPFNFILKEAK